MSQVRQRFFIIDKENTFASLRHWHLWTRSGHRQLRALGEIDLHSSSVSGRALHRDGAAMAGNDPMHHGQAHAGSIGGSFRGEKRLKDAFPDFWRHPMPRIPDREPDVGSGPKAWRRKDVLGGKADGLQAYVQFAPSLAHCVCGVGAEIQEHLVDLAGVGQDRPHTMVQVLLECDGRGQGRPQELERFLNQELELRGGTLLLGATAERENLLHESSARWPACRTACRWCHVGLSAGMLDSASSA